MLRNTVFMLGSLIFLLTTTATVVAEEAKTPANMTNEDRQQLMAGSNEYEKCVSSESRRLAPKVGDPRALTDAAMAACSNKLTELAEEMATSNYDPNYSNYYLEKVKTRVANSTLRQAIYYTSQKQRAREESDQGSADNKSQAPQQPQ